MNVIFDNDRYNTLAGVQFFVSCFFFFLLDGRVKSPCGIQAVPIILKPTALTSLATSDLLIMAQYAPCRTW